MSHNKNHSQTGKSADQKDILMSLVSSFIDNGGEPGLIESAVTGKLSKQAHNSQKTERFPETKRMMIESVCKYKVCYVRLLPALPSFAMADGHLVETCILFLTTELGELPGGFDAIVNLAVCEFILQGKSVQEAVEFCGSMTEESGFIKSLFESNRAFGFEKVGDVCHVSNYSDIHHDCKELICEHGYSSRLAFSVLSSPGVTVGGTITLDELFAQLTSEEPPHMEVKSSIPVDTNSGTVGQSAAVETRVLPKLETGHPDQKTSVQKQPNDPVKDIDIRDNHILDLQRQLSEALQRNRRQPKEVFQPVGRTDPPTSSDEDDVETLRPSDSSSCYSRYKNKYMGQGTVLTVQGRGKTSVELIDTCQENPGVDIMARGYVMTKEMSRQNKSIRKTVVPINGLSNPFRNNRLNLLCHFHTALENLPINRETSTHYDSLKYLLEYVSETPSEELAHRIILSTFDLETNTVVSNYYSLPFIEIGMKISDDCLAKCMDLIEIEYKMLWFSEMKSLKVPRFHSDYKSYKENKRTTMNPFRKSNTQSTRSNLTVTRKKHGR